MLVFAEKFTVFFEGKNVAVGIDTRIVKLVIGEKVISYFIAGVAEHKNNFLCALCDTDENRLDALGELFPNVPLFSSSDELLESKIADAVIISTPHYFHPSIALKALKSGHHVMCEKPLGVYTYGLNELFEAQKESGKLSTNSAENNSAPQNDNKSDSKKKLTKNTTAIKNKKPQKSPDFI